MKQADGYLDHYVWYRFPFKMGTVSMWDSYEHMMLFAQNQEHKDAVEWLLKPGTAKGAFIRFFDARPEGHSIGAWRAENYSEEHS